MVFFQWRALPRFAPALPRNLLHLLCPHFFLLLLFFVPFSVDGDMLRTLIENFFACSSSSSSGDSFPSCRTAFLSCVAYQWRSCCEREKERERPRQLLAPVRLSVVLGFARLGFGPISPLLFLLLLLFFGGWRNCPDVILTRRAKNDSRKKAASFPNFWPHSVPVVWWGNS